MLTHDNKGNPLPPHKIAFIIDNEVTQVLAADDRIAAIWLSEPIIVDVTGVKGSKGEEEISAGMIYDPETKTYSWPSAPLA
jgi:hypothetical protein